MLLPAAFLLRAPDPGCTSGNIRNKVASVNATSVGKLLASASREADTARRLHPALAPPPNLRGHMPAFFSTPMEDNAPQEKENPPADFNKLDLSQLQGFSFGTQWTQDPKSAPSERR